MNNVKQAQKDLIEALSNFAADDTLMRTDLGMALVRACELYVRLSMEAVSDIDAIEKLVSEGVCVAGEENSAS